MGRLQEQNQGSLIYLRDCLSLSIALDKNLTDNISGQYTEIGLLESDGKNNRDQTAIQKLADGVSELIQYLPFYKEADLICAVPPSPNKEFDLPSAIVSIVSAKVEKPDITSGFVFNGEKSSVKTFTLDEKWNVWEAAQVSFQNSRNFNVNGKK